MAVKVNKTGKRNPEEIDADAFAEAGMVVVKLGETEVVLSPEDGQMLADAIADAVEAAEEGIDTGDEEEEAEEGEEEEDGE